MVFEVVLIGLGALGAAVLYNIRQERSNAIDIAVIKRDVASIKNKLGCPREEE